MRYLLIIICYLSVISNYSYAQSSLQGVIIDTETGDPLIGVNIINKQDKTIGTITDWDGSFLLKIATFPVTINFSYIGYTSFDKTFDAPSKNLKIEMEEDAVTLDIGVEVKGQRVSEKQKAAPLTVETMDILAIKNTPSDNFYDGLGSLKGVDLTAASLGFKVINTRGFNSTSPVRSLQIIDGVDNQSPGLNFSLGNFLGSSELDVQKVDIIVGASSAFYGPNAFNGVISMETKNPFFQKGLSAQIKLGERSMIDGAIRWADVIKNKNGKDFFAYKFNFSYLQADDWVAENYNAVDGTNTKAGNPGGWDAVNIYGDEYFAGGNFSSDENLSLPEAGLGQIHRNGYKESDLVDYNTQNIKSNLSLHFRLKPDLEYGSPELILSSSFSKGNTVYQGDNRFSLKNIRFYQNRLELRKKDNWFIRFYATNENAGNSYDPYFTALRLLEEANPNPSWYKKYAIYWAQNIYPQMTSNGYPKPEIVIDPDTGLPSKVFDETAAKQWFIDNADFFSALHDEARAYSNEIDPVAKTNAFLAPGTATFNEAFKRITSKKNNDGGTLFFDKSALYHGHVEKTFNFNQNNLKLITGASFRMYRPNSEGTIFNELLVDTSFIDGIETYDTTILKITNREFGVYAGIEYKINPKIKLNLTGRADKNQNFDYIFTPAASLVYTPSKLNYFRLSYSGGVRNPTLSDQYLNFNVGPATLLGNLNGFQDLYTLESFIDYFGGGLNRDLLKNLDIEPVRPERVQTGEIGYRTTLFDALFLDISYYFSSYKDFIGYNFAVDTEIPDFGFPTDINVYRITANSNTIVNTQGFSIGANYYFKDYYSVNGNYSWNKLVKTDENDPIIPAFNTPEHKFNFGTSGRNIPLNLGFAKIKKFGFNVNYKWIQGFLFEGSPQFSGYVNDYSLLDAQINAYFKKINSTIKIGGSNLLNNKSFQTYGGPRIGRLAYISYLYHWDKK